MALFWIAKLVMGPLADRPAPDDPRLAASIDSESLFLDTDTGNTSLSNGQRWSPAGALPLGLTSDASGNLIAAGAIEAPGGFTQDGSPVGGASTGVSSLNGATGDVTLGDGTLTSVSGSGSALQVDVTLPGVASDGAGGVITQGRSISTSSSDGPVATPLITGAYDPTYSLTHTYTSDDLATSDSWYGQALVTFLTWTPTEDGDLLLLPPASDGLTGIAAEMDFNVFAGDVLGTDVPTLDGSGALPDALLDAGWNLDSATGALGIYPGSIAVTAGQVYTLAAVLFAPAFGDPAPLVGTTVDLTRWIAATERLGGQAILVPPVTATGLAAYADSDGLATAVASHADSVGFANADFSHADSEGAASGSIAHADSRGSASGLLSHANSRGIATALSSHADSGGTASGNEAHADSAASASGLTSHADSSGTASGDAGHADSAATASGAASHADSQGTATGEGSHARRSGQALVTASEAEGLGAVATQRFEHARAGGSFAQAGDAQISQIPLRHISFNTTPGALTIDGGIDGTAVPPMLAGETWLLEARIVASRADTPGTAAVYRLSGAFSVTGGTIRQIGSTTAEGWADADASTWTAVFDPHDSQVDVTVTGEAGKTIRWLGDLTITRVGV